MKLIIAFNTTAIGYSQIEVAKAYDRIDSISVLSGADFGGNLIHSNKSCITLVTKNSKYIICNGLPWLKSESWTSQLTFDYLDLFIYFFACFCLLSICLLFLLVVTGMT